MQIADREAVYVISAERETETIHFLCEVAKKQEDFRTPSKLTFFVLFFFSRNIRTFDRKPQFKQLKFWNFTRLKTTPVELKKRFRVEK